MFGYLNLNDPRKIGPQEAQEALNVRLDRGFLEYADFASAVDDGYAKKVQLQTQEIVVNSSGKVRRSYGGEDPVGIKMPVFTPTITAIPAGSNPYPPGVYDYAITLYNTTFAEESIPVLWSVTIGTNEVAKISALPDYSSTYPFKNLTWRIYRRPIGGSEFLLVDGSVAPGADFTDTVPDSGLGSACDSTDNYTPDDYGIASLIEYYAGKLFFAYDKLRYSKTENISAFPQDFFEDSVGGTLVTGLHVMNEALLFFTYRGLFYLYGSDENNFVQKQIAHKKMCGSSLASSRMVNGRIFFGGCDIDKYSGVHPDVITDLFEINGPVSRLLTANLSALFPLYPVNAGGLGVLKTGNLSNRFFILQHGGSVPDIELMKLPKHLVFDTISNGFVTGDTSGAFAYRTKEFGKPGAFDTVRRCFVTGEGSFTFQVYGDGQPIGTPETFSLAPGATRQEFTVTPERYFYWSFRITGQPGAKVYEYGRLE